jgi:hypothetical protein
MVSPPWNNFLQSLLRFIVVRSSHDEGLGTISFRLVFLILRWQKEGRYQKEEVSQLCMHECWPPFVGLFSGLLPSVCLCGHLYCKASYRFGFEIWSYSQRGYSFDENQFLDICSVIQSACNVLIYPAII